MSAGKPHVNVSAMSRINWLFLSVMLTALMAESPTERHTLVLLRGAQHGFTLHGYRLALPP